VVNGLIEIDADGAKLPRQQNDFGAGGSRKCRPQARASRISRRVALARGQIVLLAKTPKIRVLLPRQSDSESDRLLRAFRFASFNFWLGWRSVCPTGKLPNVTLSPSGEGTQGLCSMLIRFVAKSDRLIYFQGMEMRGFPASLPEFQRVFPDDAACAAYLEHLRWPAGFVCAHCGHQEEPYRSRAGRRSCCAAGPAKRTPR